MYDCSKYLRLVRYVLSIVYSIVIRLCIHYVPSECKKNRDYNRQKFCDTRFYKKYKEIFEILLTLMHILFKL